MIRQAPVPDGLSPVTYCAPKVTFFVTPQRARGPYRTLARALGTCHSREMQTAFALLMLTAAVSGLSDADLQAALRGEVVSRTTTAMRPGGHAAGQGLGAV